MGWIGRGFKFSLGWALGRLLIWFLWLGFLLAVGAILVVAHR